MRGLSAASVWYGGMIIIGVTTFFLNLRFVDLKFFLSCLIICVIISYVFFGIWDRKHAGGTGLFRCGILFLISFLIVHFQYYADYILLNNPRLFEGGITENVIKKSAILSSVGINSFLLCYTLTKLRGAPGTSSAQQSPLKKKPLPTTPLLIVQYVLFASYLVSGRGYLFSMRYGSVENAGTLFGYCDLLMQLGIYAYLIVCAYNCQSLWKGERKPWRSFIHKMGVWENFLIFSYVVCTVSTGDRGPAIAAIIACVFATQIATRRTISTSTFILLFLIGSVGIAAWGIIRSSHDANIESAQFTQAINTVSEENTVSPPTAELAGSVRTLHAAVGYVPSRYPYTLGVFQVSYALQTLPFLGTKITEIAFGGQRFTRSTAFLTFLIYGKDATSGAGTSCIADLYVEGGILGVILIMSAFGFVARKSDLLLLLPLKDLPWSKISFLFIACVFSYYFPRSMFLFHLKEFFWLLIILWFFYGKYKISTR